MQSKLQQDILVEYHGRIEKSFREKSQKEKDKCLNL